MTLQVADVAKHDAEVAADLWRQGSPLSLARIDSALRLALDCGSTLRPLMRHGLTWSVAQQSA